MAFTDKIMKGLQDATRVGSPQLDENRRRENLEAIEERINKVKIDLGAAVYMSYKSGGPIDPCLIIYCERIDSLISEGNEDKQKNVISDSGNVGTY